MEKELSVAEDSCVALFAESAVNDYETYSVRSSTMDKECMEMKHSHRHDEAVNWSFIGSSRNFLRGKTRGS